MRLCVGVGKFFFYFIFLLKIPAEASRVRLKEVGVGSSVYIYSQAQQIPFLPTNQNPGLGTIDARQTCSYTSQNPDELNASQHCIAFTRASLWPIVCPFFFFFELYRHQIFELLFVSSFARVRWKNCLKKRRDRKNKIDTAIFGECTKMTQGHTWNAFGNTLTREVNDPRAGCTDSCQLAWMHTPG